MTTQKKLLHALLVAGTVLWAVPACALNVGDVDKISVQAQLDMPLPVNGTYEIRSFRVSDVGRFKDGDGSEWSRLEGVGGKDEDGFTVFVDASEGQVEMALTIDSLELADLGTTVEQLRAMAKASQGKLAYGGKNFSFSAAARSQFTASPGAAATRLGYFILQCDEDVNLSIMVLNWGDRVEVLLNERLDASQVNLHLAGN